MPLQALEQFEKRIKLFEQMIEQGMGELDNSAVVGVLEKVAGVAILDK